MTVERMSGEGDEERKDGERVRTEERKRSQSAASPERK